MKTITQDLACIKVTPIWIRKLCLVALAGVMLLLGVGTAQQVQAHHYKGLPHYGYFENYPQVPVLEFLEQFDEYEVLVTIFNFQGMNLDQVAAPDDVRLYMYIYNLEESRTYSGDANFRLTKKDQVIFDVPNLASEQENIFVVNREITQNGNLTLDISFEEKGKEISGQMTIRIKQGFIAKYGLITLVLGLIFTIIGIRLMLGKRYKPKSRKME